MRGQWIIVDAVTDRVMSLLNIGEASFKGASVRKNLSRLARELLYDRLEDAVVLGAVFDEEQVADGQRWRVVVVPILSPTTRVPVGARGVFVEAGQPVPPAPEVGAMEWVITPDGQRTSEWDRTMYDIYELNPEDPTATRVNPGVWLAQFVAQEDQARIIELIATGMDRAQMLEREIIAYRVVTAHSRRTKRLEMSVSKAHSASGHIYMRGLTREVAAASCDDERVERGADMAMATEAWGELLADIPLARIDWLTHRLFEVSAGWHEAGLADPGQDGLLELVDEAHRGRVQAAMDTCRRGEVVERAERVRVCTAAGEPRVVDISFRALSGHYGAVRIHPSGEG